MKQRLLTAALSAGLLLGSASPTLAVTRRHHYRTTAQAIRHRRHMKTVKRVGVGAGGGAVVGALTGHPVAGAAIGAGAGALYDRHQKHHGRY